MARFTLGALLTLSSFACAEAPSNRSSLSPSANLDPEVAPVTEGDWARPATETSWQWQLLGTINTSYDVNLYDIDLFDAPEETIAELKAAGRTVICYFSAGSAEDWRTDYGDFLGTSVGNDYEGWEGESWLDIRAQDVLEVMLARLDLAVEKGCDGVEPDNMDNFQNDTGFELTATDQLAFNRRLANEAHARGLSVALKNDGDQVADLIDHFDFAVVESCHANNECEAYEPFIDAGKAVLNAEYAGDPETVCPMALDRNFRTLFLPRDLDDSSRVSCDP